MSNKSKLTLEVVEQHFNDWREHKQSRGKKIPEALWDEAKQLLASGCHKPYTIAKRLRIGTMQLRKYFPEVISKKKPKSTYGHTKPRNNHSNSVFVQAPNAAMNLATQSTITLERPDGCKLSLTALSTDHISQLVQQFVEASAC